jgi:MFS transporter, DHA2 family, methylenomycin A resistance protein
VLRLAAIALAAPSFVVIEHRSNSPMLPLVLFANPVFSWVCLAVLLGSARFFGMLFVLNLYFLRGAGYTPLQTGLAMMPLAILATTGNLASARLAHRINPMGLMISGAVLGLIGFAGIGLGGYLGEHRLPLSADGMAIAADRTRWWSQ